MPTGAPETPDRPDGADAPDRPDTSAAAPPGLGQLDFALDGIVLLDGNGMVCNANIRALELLGCNLSVARGAGFWDVVPPAVAQQHQSACEQALAERDRHSFVAHQRFENSWIEYTFRRHAGGQVVNLRLADSTHRLEKLLDSSKRYNHLIFEANPNAMWVFDLDTLRIFAVNQASLRFYGIGRKPFMALGMEALFPDGEGAALLHSLRPLTGAQDAAPEMRLCRQKSANGKEVLVELAWSHVQWDDQRAVLVSVADLSDRHVADNALRRLNAELQQQLLAVQEELRTTKRDLLAFTRAVSSDLQDSLHAADGFAARLAEKYAPALDAQGRHCVGRIQASISQIAQLVDDLRTLAQLPLMVSTHEECDLAPMCRTLIAGLRQRDPGRNVAVEMPELLCVFGSKSALGTALACLLDNAWKFTSHREEAWIRIGLAPGAAPGGAVLTIADNGAGFDAAYSSKLFSAFQRLHTAGDFPGNGLGLAIVKRVAQLHGGSVRADTAGAGGASFSLALPSGWCRSMPDPVTSATSGDAR